MTLGHSRGKQFGIAIACIGLRRRRQVDARTLHGAHLGPGSPVVLHAEGLLSGPVAHVARPAYATQALRNLQASWAKRRRTCSIGHCAPGRKLPFPRPRWCNHFLEQFGENDLAEEVVARVFMALAKVKAAAQAEKLQGADEEKEKETEVSSTFVYWQAVAAQGVARDILRENSQAQAGGFIFEALGSGCKQLSTCRVIWQIA